MSVSQIAYNNLSVIISQHSDRFDSVLVQLDYNMAP